MSEIHIALQAAAAALPLVVPAAALALSLAAVFRAQSSILRAVPAKRKA